MLCPRRQFAVRVGVPSSTNPLLARPTTRTRMVMMPITSVNPATGRPIRSYEPHDAATIEARLSRAVTAQSEFRTTGIEERAAILHRAAVGQ